MRRLLVMRHAKSSWDHEGLADHDRPLDDRGERDAPRMGRWLRRQDLVPQRIVTSTARRARDTAAEVARTAGCAGALVESERLYSATPADCLDIVREHGGDADPLMIVGHNPTFEELVEGLTNEESPMSTAAIAVIGIDVDGDWRGLSTSPEARLIRLVRPKELDAED
jgi:phosphohistidine phosphatase